MKTEEQIIFEFKALRRKTLMRVFYLFTFFIISSVLWLFLYSVVFESMGVKFIYGITAIALPMVIYANYIDFWVDCPNCGKNPSDSVEGNPIFSKQCGNCGAKLR